MMHWWYGYGHMAWMGVWWVLSALFLSALAWAFFNATRGAGSSRVDSAEDILRRRYANGELDRETYLRMLEDLRHRGGPGAPVPHT